MILLYIVIFLVFAGGCSLCYYLGSANRGPTHADRAVLADNAAKLAEIFKLRHQLQQQIALAAARGSIIEKMKKEAAELLAHRRL